MLNQFSRTELIIGKENIEKLHNSKVAIFGLGGVGSFVAEGLVRAGVENFILIDDDKISITNLNRQIIATQKTIGKYKVEVMKDRILEINPNANVEVSKEFFMPNSSHEMLNKSLNYIIDAIDTVTAKIELVETANKLNIPIISAMGTGNKLDPTQFEVSDIYETKICPLAKVMRKELKKRGVEKLKVVYSKEEPIKITDNQETEYSNEVKDNNKTEGSYKVGEIQETDDSKREGKAKNQVPGSISFVPSVAGLIIAGEVIKDIIK